MPFRLIIPRTLLDEMIAQALSEAPNECCGLLAGTVSAGLGRACTRYPLINAAASPTEYLSEPESMFRAVKDMRKQDLEVLAVYHSHPTSKAVPSRKDRADRYSEQVVHLIVSLKGDRPSVRGWWLREASQEEAGLEICD